MVDELEYLEIKRVYLELHRSLWMIRENANNTHKDTKRLRTVVLILVDLLNTYLSLLDIGEREPGYLPKIDLSALFAKQGLDASLYDSELNIRLFKTEGDKNG